MSSPFQPPRPFQRFGFTRGMIAAHVNPPPMISMSPFPPAAAVHRVVVAPPQPPPLVHRVVLAPPLPHVQRVSILLTDGMTVALRQFRSTHTMSLPGHTLRAGQSVGQCLRVLMGQLGLRHKMLKHFDITHRGVVTRVFVYPVSLGPAFIGPMSATMNSSGMSGTVVVVNFHTTFRVDAMSVDAMAYTASHLPYLM